jgi:glutamate formiminotransferase
VRPALNVNSDLRPGVAITLTGVGSRWPGGAEFRNIPKYAVAGHNRVRLLIFLAAGATLKHPCLLRPMKPLIEAVPNFSEGRDVSIIDALVDSMSHTPGAAVLDRHSDHDHNRSVITIAGEPESVAEAALSGIATAVAHIDLNRHQGVHPRIGAADVLPFVPIEGVTLEECADLARRTGRKIWERYGIPVYFYEAAATRPERVRLENIRRGQFEGLRDKAPLSGERFPDIGGASLHPTAGAIAVGARKFLIAYNINLTAAADVAGVAIAAKIARAIRSSNGGLPRVKAIGIPLKQRGLAQVSINLTDFEITPLDRVFETVRLEANRYGCEIASTEIVGLVPAKAIQMIAGFDLRLEHFSATQILETRLALALTDEALDRIYIRDTAGSRNIEARRTRSATE